MEENIIIDATDRISELPEFIVHHILSFLGTPVNLVRMSVLSKKWFALTASFPILDFNIHKIGRALRTGFPFADGYVIVRDTFLKYVAYTVSRFCEQNVSAHTLNLIMVLQEPTDMVIIDKWIGLILKKKVQVVAINVHIMGKDLSAIPNYRLPNILLSASSLTSLTLHRCELPSSLMVDVVKFKSLKLLELVSIHIDEEVIEYFSTSCPLLEEFNVRHCFGFKRFCVYRLRNLQKVWIYCRGGIEKIDIEAPNLCHLLLMDWEGTGVPIMNLASCKKLTTLSYNLFPSPTSKGFPDFLSYFPFLKNLFLRLPDECNDTLTLSSHSLRTFVLHSQCDLDKININTPNLLLFEYNDRSYEPASLVRDSTLSSAQMECYPNWNDVDTLWFLKLRRFLDNKIGFKVLKLHFTMNSINFEELKVIQSPPPYELERVELDLNNFNGLLVCVAIVDAVLWCTRPQSLTLKLNSVFVDFKAQSHLVKRTREKLLQQEDQDLTNIQIVLSSSSPSSSKAKANTNRHFRKLCWFSPASSRDQGQVITFIKEQVVQEAG